MKKHFPQIQVLTFWAILIIATSCNGQVKKDLPKDKESEPKIISVGQPKLIKNLGSLKDKGHNVRCSLQDNAGNLWFGTSGDGLYKYDGQLFTQFTTANGLNSNAVGCILEDKSGKIWIGTDDGVCLFDDNKFTKIQIEGNNSFSKAIQIAQLSMKNRINKNQKERVIVFVSSEIKDKDENLLKIA